jgi:methylation protein EvaC
MDVLENLHRQGKKVMGYGATSKSTTVTNSCGITPRHVECIVDTTPAKQGKFSPGVHIPIRPASYFHESPPDVALLFAWNHAAEIQEKEADFSANGGRWLTYVPEVTLR